MFYVTETKATLSNSSGRAQLLMPSGQVADETAAYQSAPDGSSWAFDGSAWQWTSNPTPNQPNVFAIEEVKEATQKSSKVATIKKKTATKPKKTTGKVKAASTPSSNVAKSDNATPGAQSKVHTAVLAGVGGLALLYGVYEYRQDIANAYRKFRSNRSIGSKNRP